MNRDLDMARRLAEKAAEAGGRVYYVGGFVRDRILGRENKDVDVEVHGIAPEKLIEILESLGEMTAFGESFGIFGLRHYALDIAMPRSETAVGAGHRDFLCTLDPFIGIRQAAIRRDFTMNAMLQDVLTGEILDPFGGQRDLAAGVIRHIDDRRFAEDPLRVLRAAQFAARFGYAIAPETLAVCRRMDLGALPPERVFTELEKALLKAEQPSLFFETLREMEQLGTWFPELRALTGVPQPADYHPEGDVWVHTMLVLDHAAALRERAEHPLELMCAALCHDLGKPAATRIEDDGRLHAYRHETLGVPVAAALLGRLSREKRLRRYVLNMVELHMRPNLLAEQGAGEKSFNRLFDSSVCPGDLLLLAKADVLGSLVAPERYEATEAELRARLERYQALMASPGVTGADLVAAGYKPGKAFSGALAYAHKLQLAGVDKKNALAQTLAWLRKEAEEDRR